MTLWGRRLQCNVEMRREGSDPRGAKSDCNWVCTDTGIVVLRRTRQSFLERPSIAIQLKFETHRHIDNWLN